MLVLRDALRELILGHNSGLLVGCMFDGNFHDIQ